MKTGILFHRQPQLLPDCLGLSYRGDNDRFIAEQIKQTIF